MSVDLGPQGPPQGGIHVACGYDTADVEYAKGVMDNLHIPLVKDFGTGCNPCFHACPEPTHHQ